MCHRTADDSYEIPRKAEALGTSNILNFINPFPGGARPFRDCEFAFIHPKKMNGVLLELIDYKWEELKNKQIADMQNPECKNGAE